MPTLVDKIKQNNQLVKRGTQLFDLVNESVTQQAQRQGVPVAGTVSPQAAADMGATQDQAKMAGSSAQLQNVERLAVRPSFGQAQIEEMKKTRTEKTGQEKQREAQAQALGQFGDRIAGVVKQAMSRQVPASAGTVAASLDDTKWKALGLDQAKADSLKPAVIAALAGTANQEQLAQIANTLPGLSASSTAAEITAAVNNLRQTPTNAIVTNTQQVLPNQITVAQLSDTDIQALGFNSKQELANALGLDPSEIDSKSMDQLQAAAQSLQGQDYSTVKQLQEAANDPTLSPAAREEARAVLRQMGTAGVRATEADYAKLNQQIQAGDVVELDGKQMQISELLSDEGISAAVKAYLADPKYAAQLRAISPELADFIDKNKQALTDASNQLSKEVEELAKTRADNAKLAKSEDGIPISEDFNQLVYGADWNKFRGTALVPSNAHKILQNTNYPQSFRQDYAAILADLSKSNPELAKQFANYSYEDLVKSGLNDPAKMTAYKRYLTEVNSYKKNPDPVSAISQLFPTLNDTGGLNDLIKQAAQINRAGLGSPVASKILELFGNEPINLTDKSPAGLAKLAALKTKLEQYMGLSNGNPLTPQMNGQAVDLSAIPDLAKLASELSSSVATAKADPVVSAASDGVVDETELQDLAKARSASELTSLYDKLLNGGLISTGAAFGQSSTAQTLKDLINQQAEKEFATAIGGILPGLTSSHDTPKLPSDLAGLNQLKNQVLGAQAQVSPEVRGKFDQLLRTISSRIAAVQPKAPVAPSKASTQPVGPSRPQQQIRTRYD